MNSFGGTIPVTGLNLGFLGQISRQGERVVASRPVLATAASNINFGDPVVIVPTAGGGDSYQQVADFIAGGGTFTAAKFAGVAIREVKTNLVFQTLGNNSSTPLVGSYAPNELAEALERGSITVKVNVGAPASQGTVYVRIALNGAIPAGVVGGFEAAADGANTVALTNVIFRTGVLDGDNVAEITLLNRVAA